MLRAEARLEILGRPNRKQPRISSPLATLDTRIFGPKEKRNALAFLPAHLLVLQMSAVLAVELDSRGGPEVCGWTMMWGCVLPPPFYSGSHNTVESNPFA